MLFHKCRIGNCQFCCRFKIVLLDFYGRQSPTATSFRNLQTIVRETLSKARHPGQTGPHYSLTKYRLALEWSEAMLAKKANLNRRGLRFKAEVRHFCVVTEWRQMAIPGYKRGIFVPTALPSSLMPTIQRESVFCIERYRQIETDRQNDR